VSLSSNEEKRRKERPTVFYVELFKFLRTAVIAGAWLGAAYCLVLIARAFAGQATTAKIMVALAVRAYAHLGTAKFAWLITGGSIGYALLERRERRRKTEKLSQRNRELELRLDPTRSSSGLLPNGDTREDDK
jgi:hypothetical protein